MANWEDIGTSANQTAMQNPAVPGPKTWESIGTALQDQMPDTGGVAKTINDNLSKQAPEAGAAPQDIHDAINAGTGMNVGKLLSSDNTYGPPVPAAMRQHYVDSLKTGTSSSFGDWFHSVLPDIAQHTQNFLEGGKQEVPGMATTIGGSLSRGFGELAYNALQNVQIATGGKPLPPPEQSKDALSKAYSDPLLDNLSVKNLVATIAHGFPNIIPEISVAGAGAAVGSKVPGGVVAKTAGGIAGAGLAVMSLNAAKLIPVPADESIVLSRARLKAPIESFGVFVNSSS